MQGRIVLIKIVYYVHDMCSVVYYVRDMCIVVYYVHEMCIVVYYVHNMCILPHSAPSWILSYAENQASSILQDGATKWHDFAS